MLAIKLLPVRTSETMLAKALRMRSRCATSRPISSPAASMCEGRRSPSATRVAMVSASVMGCVMERAMNHDSMTPPARADNMMARIAERPIAAPSRASW